MTRSLPYARGLNNVLKMMVMVTVMVTVMVVMVMVMKLADV